MRCSPDEAFRLFTERISEWWPKTHRLSKDPESELILAESGRFWERARDGREIELGRVRVWEPPQTLAMDFYMGTGPAQPTSLEVTFTPAQDGTRVTVRHNALPETGDLWNQFAPRFEQSWDAVLAALASW